MFFTSSRVHFSVVHLRSLCCFFFSFFFNTSIKCLFSPIACLFKFWIIYKLYTDEVSDWLMDWLRDVLTSFIYLFIHSHMYIYMPTILHAYLRMYTCIYTYIHSHILHTHVHTWMCLISLRISLQVINNAFMLLFIVCSFALTSESIIYFDGVTLKLFVSSYTCTRSFDFAVL